MLVVFYNGTSVRVLRKLATGRFTALLRGYCKISVTASIRVLPYPGIILSILMTFQERRAAGLILAKKYPGEMRGDGTEPGWHHLDRVSRLLEYVLEQHQEGTLAERETIALAGLGHDALEDTKVTTAELTECFGTEGLALIEGMTNRFGDDHPAPYVTQVVNAPEGVRLIKYADLFDNCMSVNYVLTRKTTWTESYFLPIVRPMMAALSSTSFHRFPKTAETLRQMVKLADTALLEGVERWRLTLETVSSPRT